MTPISVLPPVDFHTRVVDLQKYQSDKPAFKYLSISTFICGTEWSCLTEFCFQIISFSGSSPPVQHWQCSHWSRTCRRCWGWPAPWTHRTRPSRPPPPRAPWDRRMAGDSYHSYWTATYVYLFCTSVPVSFHKSQGASHHPEGQWPTSGWFTFPGWSFSPSLPQPSFKSVLTFFLKQREAWISQGTSRLDPVSSLLNRWRAAGSDKPLSIQISIGLKSQSSQNSYFKHVITKLKPKCVLGEGV